MHTQVKLVHALCALHNFVHVNDNRDFFVVTYTEPTDVTVNVVQDAPLPASMAPSEAEKRQAKQMRERIAQQMWDDYCGYMGIAPEQ